MDIHLCIVTGQPLANLIPILQYRPEQIALVVSDQMKDNSARFVRILEFLGWKENCIHEFHGLPSDSFEAMQQYAMDIYEQLERRYPEARIIYNATGGNKLMALAFSQWFTNDRRNQVIYADTSNRHIEYISTGSKETIVPMQNVLDLKVYLRAHGKTLRSRQDQDNPQWQERALQRKKATRFLAENFTTLEGFVRRLNGIYGEEKQADKAPPVLRFSGDLWGDWEKALELLVSGGVLDKGEDGREWYPKSCDAAVYLSGAWLEEYAYFAAKDAGAQEVALNVVFTDDFDRKADIRNELDVVVVHNNQLLVIECKTGNITRDRKDQDTVNKLDSLTNRVGGALGAGALVSFHPLKHRNRDGRSVNVQARANSAHRFTCAAEQLADLRTYIKNWMESGQWGNQH